MKLKKYMKQSAVVQKAQLLMLARGTRHLACAGRHALASAGIKIATVEQPSQLSDIY